MIDLTLEENSNLLNQKCCRVTQNNNNEIRQKSNENKEMKIKKYSERNIILLGSKMRMINIVR